MPYYVRVLSTDRQKVTLQQLQSFITEESLPVSVIVEVGTKRSWKSVCIRHNAGVDLADLEYAKVARGSLGGDEIQEFMNEMSSAKPATNAAWLREYLASVKSIYAFRILDVEKVTDGWETVRRVQEYVRCCGGIIQADGEGFSNEDGLHIIWQFSDDVTGEWWMALRNADRWVAFQMELGDRRQRAAFLRGEVPHGAKIES